MSRNQIACLAIIIAMSIVGIYYAYHLADMHYNKPKYQLNLINTLPFMERLLDREKIAKAVSKQEVSNLNDSNENEEYDPYAAPTDQSVENKEAGFGEEPCDISETLSCTAVDESKYSEVFGLALSVYGIAGYTILIILSILCLLRKRKDIDVFSFLLYIGCWFGFFLSAYLTLIEFFVIKAFCPYCVISAVAMTVILVCILVAYGFSPLGIFMPKKLRG
ncbi:MAG: vitamin K epoxide reductase family protein [Desulfopila sp.]